MLTKTRTAIVTVIAAGGFAAASVAPTTLPVAPSYAEAAIAVEYPLKGADPPPPTPPPPTTKTKAPPAKQA